MGLRGAFISLAAIATAVQSYVRAYYQSAPSDTTLTVAIGTNNSCGTGQPCGQVICGCPDEPTSFAAWGGEFALTVEQVGAWTTAMKLQNGFTDDLHIVAADDAEPGFDPAFENTYAVLEGYAEVVAGPYPAMVDYGSADAHYWTEDQLLQVAYGFQPDVPMPEIYNSTEATEWASLLRYAKFRHHETVVIYGVLTGGSGTNSPQTAYADILDSVTRVTGQQSIDWVSTITRWRGRASVGSRP